MEGKHFALITLIVLLVFVLIEGVFCYFLHNDEINRIESVIQEISDMNELISKTDVENLYDSVISLNTVLADIETNTSDELNSISSDFSSHIDTLTGNLSAMEAEQKKIVDNMNQSVTTFSEKVDVFSQFLRDSSVDGKATAKQSFDLASDASRSYSERRYYFLNALMHDPTEVSYYNEFIAFLDTNNASPEEYWMISSILDTAMMQMDPDSITNLLPIYESITSISYVDDDFEEDEVVDYHAQWIENTNSFLALVKSDSFSLDELQNHYDQALLSYGSLEDLSQEDQALYEEIDMLYSLHSSFLGFKDLYLKMIKMDDDAFLSSYPTTSQIAVSVRDALLISSVTDEYQNALDDAYNELIMYIEILNSRYDEIRANRLVESINSLLVEFEVVELKTQPQEMEYLLMQYSEFADSDIDSVLKRYKEIQVEFSIYASSVTSQKGSEYIVQIQESLDKAKEKVYVYQFTEYQLWASEILVDATSVKSEYSKEEQLDELYNLGYFEINPALLIPQLLTVYNSIEWTDMEKRSEASIEELVRKYNPVIKGLGEI